MSGPIGQQKAFKRLSSQSFDQGYACAVACIVRGHGGGTETREALEARGFLSVQIAKERGIEAYDMEVLTPLLREIEARQKRKQT